MTEESADSIAVFDTPEMVKQIVTGASDGRIIRSMFAPESVMAVATNETAWGCNFAEVSSTARRFCGGAMCGPFPNRVAISTSSVVAHEPRSSSMAF